MISKIIEIKKLQQEIIEGLSSNPKHLPSKLFYDDKGSKLFDQICELDEYYPTRTELKIMQDNLRLITGHLKDVDAIIELGSGNSMKTKILLNNLHFLKYYIPVDISSSHLQKSADELKMQYVHLKILPVTADYTVEFEVPFEENMNLKRLVYFPGSTIGNFIPEQAREFLKRIREIAKHNGALLIGVDLVKDIDVLTKAYNDSEGVTEAFNKNILSHINKIFNSRINIDCFRHEAIFNETDSRIEMYLISLKDQEVRIGDRIITFQKDEPVLTEYSYKYTIDGFRELCEGIFKVKRIWTDPHKYFSVQLLT